MVEISVVIPHFDQQDSLKKCIDALKHQTLDQERYEVIVVHNEGVIPEILFQIVGNTSNIYLEKEPKPGSYAARNTGIKKAKGKYIAFTDSDCIPDKNWLEVLLNQFSRVQEPIRISGEIAIIPPTAPKVDWCYQYETVFEFRQKRSAEGGTAVTANMAVTKTILDDIGGFEEGLKSGGDKLWNVKASSHGVPLLYEPLARVWHPSRNNLSQICRKYRRTYGGWFVKYGWNERSAFMRFVFIAYPLRPPIRPIKELIQAKPGLPKFMKVLSVLFVIRLVRVYEHLRLSFGASPLR